MSCKVFCTLSCIVHKGKLNSESEGGADKATRSNRSGSEARGAGAEGGEGEQGAGMPGTLLCTVRAQTGRAGSETRPEHREGPSTAKGGTAEGRVPGCAADCYPPCALQQEGRDKKDSPNRGARAHEGRGARSRWGGRERRAEARGNTGEAAR